MKGRRDYKLGADPGCWERGGLINIFTTRGGGKGGGVAPPVTARASGGALIAPPVRSGAHEIHSDIQYIYITRYPDY